MKAECNGSKNSVIVHKSEQYNGLKKSEQCNGLKKSEQCIGSKK